MNKQRLLAHTVLASIDKAKKAFATYLELAPNGTGAVYARQQVEKG
jgi:hypothetical protein